MCTANDNLTRALAYPVGMGGVAEESIKQRKAGEKAQQRIDQQTQAALNAASAAGKEPVNVGGDALLLRRRLAQMASAQPAVTGAATQGKTMLGQ